MRMSTRMELSVKSPFVSMVLHLHRPYLNGSRCWIPCFRQSIVSCDQFGNYNKKHRENGNDGDANGCTMSMKNEDEIKRRLNL